MSSLQDYSSLGMNKRSSSFYRRMFYQSAVECHTDYVRLNGLPVITAVGVCSFKWK